MDSFVACAACTRRYSELSGELSTARQHGPVLAGVRKSQRKNHASIRSLGQNHNGRREWLWAHALDSFGEYIGHRRCIAKLTNTSLGALTRLRAAYKRNMSEKRKFPAQKVLDSDKLLKDLLYNGTSAPPDWHKLSVRRKWLNDLIETTGDKLTLVYLPQSTIETPIHRNAFTRKPLRAMQKERFQCFVSCNSVPTGRRLRGKTHYLLPTIRRLKNPRKPEEN